MLVYGKGTRTEAPPSLLDCIRAALRESDRLPGLDRHARLVAALLDAGALAQGLADRTFEAGGGTDDVDPLADAALGLARAIAVMVARSWRSGFAGGRERLDDAAGRLAALADATLPATVTTRDPEGFLHYAVYPEAYLAAAETLPPGPLVVIGIRSVGATLAPVVAAARDEVAALMTVRPTGHPFRRALSLSSRLADRVRAHASATFAIVDEGPGLSGSSIAAVVQSLEALGVASRRIHVMPSHGGIPGPEADRETREAWGRVTRHVATFDDIVLRSSSRGHRLESWFADRIGNARGDAVEISGGRWRALSSGAEESWPPAHPWQERRKFLLRTETGTWLLRFVGLGRFGSEKLALARSLAEAGFVPGPLGLRHGFMVERWHDAVRTPDHDRIVDRLGPYLAFRATLTVEADRSGASVATLFDVLLCNAAQALGAEAVEVAEGRWRPRLAALEAARRPMRTDNRLHRWEWLEVDGIVLKADAIDHWAGHDLVGCQDIAWDIAGAAVEFDLDDAEAESLTAAVERVGGRPVDRDLARFCRAGYAAFQLGYYTMAANGAQGAEAGRLSGAASRYRDRLRAELAGDEP